MGEVLHDEAVQAAAVTREAGTHRLLALLNACGCPSPEAADRLWRYHELLCERNRVMNLTGDTDFDVMLTRHYADSLAPLRNADWFPQGASLLDVGTGAGFPGLPLAVARPDLHVTLLDSLRKRVEFLNDVIAELRLANVTAVHARSEDAARQADMREHFDIVCARAVASSPVLCELLLPFARVGGAMLCWKGPAARDELPAAEIAAAKLGGSRPVLSDVTVPGDESLEHCVLRCEKHAPTPKAYPRKAGTPQKSPLG